VGHRRALEACIEAGGGEIGLDRTRALLQELEKRPPPKLKTHFEKRIKLLERIQTDPKFAQYVESATAVLEAYTSGNLGYIPGHYYVFKDGKEVAGPRPLSEFDPSKLINAIDCRQ
jgi:hypothetical protein